MAEEEDDGLSLIELGLLLFRRNRYDIYELYRKIDDDGADFIFGKYEIKKTDYVIGRSSNKEELSRNLSTIVMLRNKNIHRFVGAKVRIKRIWLFLN